MSRSAMEQLFVMREMLGGGDWFKVALLLALVGVAVFKPERINSPGAFRLAGILFGVAVIAPCLNWLVMGAMLGGSSGRVGSSGGEQYLVGLLQGIEPVLLGLTVIALLVAIQPRRPRAAPPPPLHPHPLD